MHADLPGVNGTRKSVTPQTIKPQHHIVPDQIIGLQVPVPNADTAGACGQLQTLLTLVKFLFGALAVADVGTNRHIHIGLAGVVHERCDGGQHPIQVPVFGAVANLRLPGFATRQRAVHLFEKPFWVGARVEHGVVLPQQFFACVAADLTELVVDRENTALHIGGGHNGVLVQRGQSVGVLQVDLGLATLQVLNRPFAGRDIGGQSQAHHRENKVEEPVPCHVREGYAVAKETRALHDPRGTQHGNHQQHHGGAPLAQAQRCPSDEQKHPVALRDLVHDEVDHHGQPVMGPVQKHHTASHRGHGKNQRRLGQVA